MAPRTLCSIKLALKACLILLCSDVRCESYNYRLLFSLLPGRLVFKEIEIASASFRPASFLLAFQSGRRRLEATESGRHEV